MHIVKIVDQIDLMEAYSYLQAPEAGAINLFVGTVRNHSHGKKVEKLAFEAYAPMAVKEMEKLIAEAEKRWPV